MPTTSSLRLFRNLDSLDPDDREYWRGYIAKREHLKREYPQGIPMRILYPTGLFNARELHGAYTIDGSGRPFIASAEIAGTSLPGPREIPLSWYLLFAFADSYVAPLDVALASLERAGRMLGTILDSRRFDLVREESSVYFLQRCQPQDVAGLAAFLGSEDDLGFIELQYGDTGLACDPLIAARILEDKRTHLFPRQLAAALDALVDGNHALAEELFEEVCLIHRYLRETPAREPERCRA